MALGIPNRTGFPGRRPPLPGVASLLTIPVRVEIIGHCAVLAAEKGGPVAPIVDQWIIAKLAGETDDGRPGAPFGPPS